MRRIARSYHGASQATGPLIFVANTRGAVMGEWVVIDVPDQPLRRGQVVDAGDEISVIQVLDDPHGLSPATATVTLTGETASVAVGRELLGRALSGVGAPRDGLPAPIGEARRAIWGEPMNPVRRESPSAFIETGISAIDGLNTLVRGQKLPIFSGHGLPALDLVAQVVEYARAPGGEPFAVVFAAVGITEREAATFLSRFTKAEALERTVLYLNLASDPTIERLLTPRVALTAAEHLAFAHGIHVLVVIADLTHYCEALRELSTAREEVPGRRGYPGYMYTDLANLFERAGVLSGRAGSVTQLPVVTVPDDDMTHPIADLTGYITEGQVVLSRDLHRRGVFPPVSVLPSLSRLMNAGIGVEKTVGWHRQWADQLYAINARGEEARLMAAIVGESGLTASDRLSLNFVARFESEFLNQGNERRSLAETLEIGWQLLDDFPRHELSRIGDSAWDERQGVRAKTQSVSERGEGGSS